MGYKWKPLEQATLDRIDYSAGANRRFVELQMEIDGSTFEQAKASIVAYYARCEYWVNDLYQVEASRIRVAEFGGVDMVHIIIRRRDGAAIFDWRHRQRIKNDIVGPECEAFEIYPAESRLVDTSNKYHLWAFVDPKARLPVGIEIHGRDVVENEVKSPAGMRQRAF